MNNQAGKKTATWEIIGICLFIVLAVWMVFGQALGHGFVNYDDNKYVYENPMVQKGMTWPGFVWAFTYGQIGHWHPLTWLSHMLDCQLYGLNAEGHHLTNLLFHAATAVLLFLVLRQMTGALWRSAFVAVVFAIHPLRVESVAWVSERKDVLSGFFFMLTLAAYVRYVRSPTSRVRYVIVGLLFALGLLSKNMLVTLPFILLLLDYWPLGRFEPAVPGSWRPLIIEKIPLFLLSLASCLATILVPEKVSNLDWMPFPVRLENAVVAHGVYLQQLVWPAGLAIPYMPTPLAAWQVAASGILLVIISAGIFAFRRHRYLVVGWLWYLGMMVPVIGIMQISYYVRADRYTYLPQIGLIILAAWAVTDLCSSWRAGRWFLIMGGATIIAVLIAAARTQVSYWKNGETLFLHTMAVAPNNIVACKNLATFCSQEGRMPEAMKYYARALQINPENPDVLYDLGNAFAQMKDWDNAINNYRHALQITPDQADVLDNLGFALAAKKQFADATGCFEAALKLNPDSASTHNNLASVLFREQRYGEAAQQFREALRVTPDDPRIFVNLGDTLLRLGKPDEAIPSYQAALRLKPGDLQIQAKLQALGVPASN
ncbi:MAG: tetratricopeptide repeat protein [Verrucomicrobiia bacterium]